MASLSMIRFKAGVVVARRQCPQRIWTTVMVLTFQVDPQVVRVEYLEFPHRFEVLDVLRGHLSNFEQLKLALMIDQCATLESENEQYF